MKIEKDDVEPNLSSNEPVPNITVKIEKDDLGSNLSPNKRPRTLATEKGKEKIESQQEEEEEICGICFSKEGEALRGWIDCCSHYFCFVCIMEWSKIESRCPMCKKRFTTICRPPKDLGAISLQQRVINVPTRDQVSRSFGNEANGYSDPYAQLNCVECQNSADDNLLLICDLCDSGAHTYCVGLGFTVPEGEWYCNDCTISRNERHRRTHTQINTDVSNTNNQNVIPTSIPLPNTNVDVSVTQNSNAIPVAIPWASAGMYVNQGSNAIPTIPLPSVDASVTRESSAIPTAIPLASVSVSVNRGSSTIPHVNQNSNAIPVAIPSVNQNSNVSEIVQETSDVSISEIVRETYFVEVPRPSEGIPVSSSARKRDAGATDRVNGSSARTLSRCRNVHNRIRAMRENWEALRGGSLNFSPQKTTQDRVSGHNDFYNIDKAWKMLDIATSVQQARKYTQNKFQPSKSMSGKQSVSKEVPQRVHKEENYHWPGKAMSKEAAQRVQKEAANTNSGFSIPKSKPFQEKEMRGVISGKNAGHIPTETVHKKNQAQKSSDRNLTKDALKGSLKYCSRPSSGGHPSVKKAQIQEGLCPVNGENMEISSSVVCERRGNIFPIAERESMPAASSVSHCRSVVGASYVCTAEVPLVVSEVPLVKSEEVKSSTKLRGRKDEAAKCEVQTLVKLNLKLLNRDKQLGVVGFKEVARLATHTILAACGLEHKSSSVRPFPDPVCKHNAQSHQLHKSNLMKSSCRECFYTFVKNVVSSIMVEKIAVSQ